MYCVGITIQPQSSMSSTPEPELGSGITIKTEAGLPAEVKIKVKYLGCYTKMYVGGFLVKTSSPPAARVLVVLLPSGILEKQMKIK